MKHKLLLLGALLTLGASASAQNFTANRQKLDAPETTAWVAEDTVYLWNTGAKGFYINHQGGSGSPYWGTRAVVSKTKGAKTLFTRTNPGGESLEDWTGTGVQDNTYLLVSYVSRYSVCRATFTTGWNSVWTDNNTANLRWFNIIAGSNNTFKIEPNTTMLIDGATIADAIAGYEFIEGLYLGVVDGDNDLLVNLFDTRTDVADDGTETLRVDPSKTFYSDWACVTPAAYENYFAVMDVYNAAESLKEAIEEAIAANPGLTLNDQVAVYNNTSATAEELAAAEATIAQAVYDYVAGGATPANPADVSSKIVNGTFDTIGNFTGWQGSSFGAGGTTGPSAERYGMAFDTYQPITGLKAGVYKLTAKAFFRKTNAVTDYAAYLAGTAAETTLYINGNTYGKYSTPIQHIAAGAQESAIRDGATSNYDVTDADGATINVLMPNTMAEADLYFHDADGNATNLYDNEVLGAIAEGDTLWIGVQNTVGGSSDWSIFDDFKLYYLGSSDEAYAALKDNAVAANAYELPEETYYSQVAYDAYTAAYAALQAASGEAALTAIAPVKAALDSISASITAYASYIAKIDEINAWLEAGEAQGMAMDIDEVLLVSDYVQLDAGDAEEGVYPNGALNDIVNVSEGEYGGKLTAGEITTELEYLTSIYDAAVKNALLPGADLTSLITNPGFETSGGKGWSLDTSKGGTSNLTNWHGGSSTNYCAEAYQQNFDVYQVIEGLPAGLYSVSVQAFYRTGTNDVAYQAYLADPEMTGDAKVYPEVYFNEFSSPVKNVMEIQYDENLASNCYQTPAGTYTLNGMASASAAFSLEDEDVNFTQHAYGLVGDDGKMRLGIRKLSGPTSGQQWTLWDNFKITYVGKDITAMKSVIENYQDRIAALDLTKAGTPDVDAVNNASDAADAASGAEEIYVALQDLVSAYNTVVASIDAYAELQTASDELSANLEAYASTASDDAISTASDLLDESGVALQNMNLSGDEALALVDKLNAASSDLKIPNYDDASDSNPIDFSSVITNATFDTIGDFTGWTSGFGAGGTTSTNAEVYNSTSFNVYQDITNLPIGTYEIRVNGFNRTGSATQDYSDFKEYEDADVDPTLTTYLYGLDNPAVNDITTTPTHASTVAIKHLASGADSDNSRFSTVASENPAAYVPNSMAEADVVFHDEGAPYLVSTIINVTDDGSGKGTLRIGVYKNDPSAKSTNWSIFDDFQLYYLGQNSSRGQGGNAVDINSTASSAKAISTTIYTADGVRTSKLQKGINIVKSTLSDGTVKTRKVFVK